MAAAALRSPAQGATRHDGALRSARIAFDTSARSSPAQGVFPVSVVIAGLRGDDRITLADGVDLAVARDVAAPAVVDLTLRAPARRSDLDHIVTSLSTSADTAERWIFHYTLTLTFAEDSADSSVLQKGYAVTLGQESPLAMTQTGLPATAGPDGGAPGAAADPRADADTIERIYAELEATYALLEEAIEGNRSEVSSFRPPIWAHNTLGSLRLDGDQAVMTVRQSHSRMQLVNGKLRKVETSVTQDETWLPTPDGWKRRFVANQQDAEWYVDGKQVEPGKPYDESAPPYEPPPWTPPPPPR